MKTIEHPFSGLRKRRLLVSIMTFVIGFLCAVILLGSSTANAQKDCLTAAPTATPGGVLTFSGTGETSIETPVTFKEGVYSIKAEISGGSRDSNLVSIEAIALDATQKDCTDKFLFQQEVKMGSSKSDTARYNIYGNAKSCQALLKITVSDDTDWKITITPLKT